MDQAKHENKLKSGLVLWASAHDVKPVEFSQKLGYAYATAWDLLRGKRPFTPEAFGRFAIGYGTQAAAELMRLADLPDGVDVDPISDGEGNIVPAVTVSSSASAKMRKRSKVVITPAQQKIKRVVENAA